MNRVTAGQWVTDDVGEHAFGSGYRFDFLANVLPEKKRTRTLRLM